MLRYQAALMPLKIWRVPLTMCVLSGQNKVTLLWVHGHSGTQVKEDTDPCVREGLSTSFLGPRLSISISSCVGVEDWLKERHSKHLAAASGIRQSKLFLERPYK
jgi:hypothetical protein